MTASTDHEPSSADQDGALSAPPDDPRVGPVRVRRERLLPLLDLSGTRGLEIGALCAPVATRDVADVCYVDVQSTEDLAAHYRGDPAVPAELLVDVDVALYADGRLRSIAAATAGAGPFGWGVASHVVEHVPDLVGWLADLAAALQDDGLLALVVPDRRYTYDDRRPATTTGQLLAAHLRHDQRPSVRAVYDHFSATVTYPTHELWRGGRPGPEHRANPREVLTDVLRRHRETDEYIDCHTWVFHPREFVAQMAELAGLGMLDFVIDQVITTPVDELEFYVVLRRLPRAIGDEERATEVASGFECPDDKQLSAPPVGPADVLPSGVALRAVTDKEWGLIQRKRAVLAPLVSLLARARRRG